MRIDFNGAVALVTGAASGIGRAAALSLHAAGARVAGADRDETGLQTLDSVLPIGMDVRRDDEIEIGVARVEAELGPIDILVTAAGLLQRPRPPESLPMAEWDAVTAVNWRGVYRCCALVGAAMAARGRGAIVTVSSVTAFAPGPLHAYAPAKAALVNLTQSLAAEWGSRGVRVNSVAPGYVATPAFKRAQAFGFVDAEKIAQKSALGRLASEEEVAQTIVFLASDLASGISGVTIPVDAGYLAAMGWRGLRDLPAQGA